VDYSFLLLVGGCIFIIYFVMIRPQQKERATREAMLTSLTKGDKIVTNSGLHGKIVAVEDVTIVLEVASKTSITIDKAAVGIKIQPETAEQKK